MDLNLLLSYIRQPVVLYTIILVIFWLFLLLISTREGHKRFFIGSIFSKYILIVVLLMYIILTFFLILLGEVSLYPILHAVMFGLTMLAISLLKPEKTVSVLHFCLTFTVALMPIIVMISTKHPLPLGDDARFPGFAITINENGRWAPNTYAENPYYQFFHLIPYMEYVLASITGISLNNVEGYYLPLKICMYLSYMLSAYLVTKMLTKSSVASLLVVLLLSITPPLAMSQVVHQTYAIILFLFAIFLFLKRIDEGSNVYYTIAVLPILATGVVAHATFTLMLIAFIMPLILMGGDSSSNKSLSRVLLLLVVASLSYWIYIYIFDLLVRSGLNAVDRLVDLFMGRTLPWQETRQAWYPEETQYFVAWALIPSMVGAFVLFSIFKLALHRKRLNVNLTTVIGSLGLVGTGLNYVLRTLPTFGGRYFYWLYLLMLPLSTIVMVRVSRRTTSLMIAVLIISAISFYGIQDPTISANTYGDHIGWADKTSWNLAQSLIPYINSSEVRFFLDPRISCPISALTPPPLTSYAYKNVKQVCAIIGMDNIGLGAMQNDPHNRAFFTEVFGLEPKALRERLQNFDIIFNSGQNIGIMK